MCISLIIMWLHLIEGAVGNRAEQSDSESGVAGFDVDNALPHPPPSQECQRLIDNANHAIQPRRSSHATKQEQPCKSELYRRSQQSGPAQSRLARTRSAGIRAQQPKATTNSAAATSSPATTPQGQSRDQLSSGKTTWTQIH